ncbi:TonB-dependent siderophore receptor [Acuticoccus sediminis]|nr:TonB-dependent siderophore receptor [Acuticoccus sediminis]
MKTNPCHDRPGVRPMRVAVLSALLSGTALGLPAAAWAQSTVEGPSIVLDPITVDGQAAASDSGSGTVASTGYDPRGMSFGGLLNQPVREIPQTVTVLTEERLNDQNITVLDDAVAVTPGLRAFRNDPGRSSLFSRGFEFDSYFVDGLWSPLSSIAGSNPDLAPFSAVEFLKGPSALYAGAGNPGGIVNLVRKRGLEEYRVEGRAGYGSWDHWRGMIDAGGPLNAAKTVRARAVLAGESSDGFVDDNEWDGGVGYAAVDVDLTDNTTLSIGAWHQRRSYAPSNALPTYPDGELLDVSRDTFLGADWNEFDTQQTSVIGELEHRFEDGSGHMRLSARYTDQQGDGFYAYTSGPADPVTGDVSMTSAAIDVYDKALHVDAHIDKAFEVMGLEQNILVGTDLKYLNERFYRGSGASALPNNNIYNPDPDFARPDIAWRSRTDTTSTEVGAYGQVRIKPWEPLTLIAGVRASGYDADVKNLLTDTKTHIGEAHASPYVGAVYDVTDNISLYASYTTTFQPQTELDAGGDPLGPREAEQYEVGIKTQWLDDKLGASLSAYHLKDRNRAIANPDLPGTYTASGAIEVNGIEASVNGSPLPGWDIFAAYTYQDMQYVEDSADLSYRYYLPQHQFNLWTKYTVHQGPLDGAHVAGGVNVTGPFHNIYNGVRIEEDGYVTVDGQVGYTFRERFSATLTVTNIFNEKYYERIGTTGTFNFYGQPRAIWGELSATF